MRAIHHKIKVNLLTDTKFKYLEIITVAQRKRYHLFRKKKPIFFQRDVSSIKLTDEYLQKNMSFSLA